MKYNPGHIDLHSGPTPRAIDFETAQGWQTQP